MNTNKQRRIGNNTLKRILPLMDKNCLNNLPNKPQKLLKYVKRRISPFISPYISHSLKLKMYNYRMTDEEYLLSFYNAISSNFSKLTRVEKPVLSIILSQTGAGKTELAKLILNKRKNSVIINTDNYKKFNPKLEQIFKKEPFHIAELTAIDSYDLTNNIKEFAFKNKYNIICEFAPSKNGIIEINKKAFINQGYKIEYHILAVGDLVSSLSIHSRYEKHIMGIEKEKIKLTNINRHDESYKELLKVIQTLPVDKTYIYRRGTKEEGFIPQLLDNNKFKSKQKLYLSLISEREKSNKLYALGQGINNNFIIDYFKIKNFIILFFYF